MTDELLRAECEQWLMKHTVLEEEKKTVGFPTFDDIVVFAKRQRAAGLREALMKMDEYLSRSNQEFGIVNDWLDLNEWCDARATEYET